MNQEEQMLIDTLSKETINQTNVANDVKNILSKYNQTEINNPALIDVELNPERILERIYHSLSQHILIAKNVGGVNRTEWVEQKDYRMRVLSDLGVELIMDKLNKYLSPVIILSNHDDTQILWKMHDIGEDLNDLLFCRYEDIFYYPDPWQIYFFLLRNRNYLGYNYKYQLFEKCKDMSNDILADKIKSYIGILNDLLNIIHATYLRSLHGEELKGLRRITNVNQTQTTSIYPTNDLQKNKGGFIK